MKSEENREPSESGRLRSFYDIVDNGDGTADVYLDKGTVFPMTDGDGETDYDVLCRVMRGVVLYDGIEEDIRRNYEKWYQSAEIVWL